VIVLIIKWHQKALKLYIQIPKCDKFTGAAAVKRSKASTGPDRKSKTLISFTTSPVLLRIDKPWYILNIIVLVSRWVSTFTNARQQTAAMRYATLLCASVTEWCHSSPESNDPKLATTV
jgi:hypothetical protein